MNITKTDLLPKQSIIDCKCDCCGKMAGEPFPKKWFNFSHGHSEWGNDSVDSYEYFDVCSPECFANQLEKSIDELEGYRRSAKIADMNYDFAKTLYLFMIKKVNNALNS